MIYWSHKKKIRQLYAERFSLLEIYIMYNERISFRQLRSIVKGVKREEKLI